MNLLNILNHISNQITKCNNHDINLNHFKSILKDIKIKDLNNILEQKGYFGCFRLTSNSLYYVHKGTVNV